MIVGLTDKKKGSINVFQVINMMTINVNKYLSNWDWIVVHNIQIWMFTKAMILKCVYDNVLKWSMYHLFFLGLSKGKQW